jgi:mono/diheme cytochrome c family protein
VGRWMGTRTIHSMMFLLSMLQLAPSVLLPNVGVARDDVPSEISERANPESLEEGELRYYARQFKGKCARCHGKDGRGGEEVPPPPMRPPADFTDASHMKSRTDGELYYQILMGGGEFCAMPAFGPESDYAWSDEKIWHMVAFVRRFSASGGE